MLPTMTDDRWRTIYIVSIVLAAVFGGLLALVAFNQRGHRTVRGRGATISAPCSTAGPPR
jgi:hypothetical protein